jgi:hypothetical protein
MLEVIATARAVAGATRTDGTIIKNIVLFVPIHVAAFRLRFNIDEVTVLASGGQSKTPRRITRWRGS